VPKHTGVGINTKNNKDPKGEVISHEEKSPLGVRTGMGEKGVLINGLLIGTGERALRRDRPTFPKKVGKND